MAAVKASLCLSKEESGSHKSRSVLVTRPEKPQHAHRDDELGNCAFRGCASSALSVLQGPTQKRSSSENGQLAVWAGKHSDPAKRRGDTRVRDRRLPLSFSVARSICRRLRC